MEPGQELGPHQLEQPLLRVHVPRRHGLQPGQPEPDAVRRRRRAQFDVEAYRRASALTILAQEILVDHADYPTQAIAKNSHLYRPLGLGYANLGALLMSMGLPYDSDAGRNMAASLTAVMCGQAYATSAEIAEAMGPFPRYKANRKPFLEVIGMHKDAAEAIPGEGVPADLHEAARDSWAEALELGKHGYKNGQVTVLAHRPARSPS